MTQSLLDWYDKNARDLVWRISPQDRREGQTPDPYKVWLSEIMLQQTTAPHAAPYYLKFLKLWPNVDDLAAASHEDIMREWAGLGYYARARNLHKCAKQVVEDGGFPTSAKGLQDLPGVGPYTSAAIASIAYDEQIAPVDGNVERILSRAFTIAGDGTAKGWAQDKRQITAKAQTMAPERRAGDFAQAMMDLGATICAPKRPNCGVCPWFECCEARKEGMQEAYPAKPKKKPLPTRRGTAFVLVADGKVYLQRRAAEGLLGGMLMPPSTPWQEGGVDDAFAHAPTDAEWSDAGQVRHVFTHFALEWDVLVAKGNRANLQGEWKAASDIKNAGLPTVGLKAVVAGLAAIG